MRKLAAFALLSLLLHALIMLGDAWRLPTLDTHEARPPLTARLLAAPAPPAPSPPPSAHTPKVRHDAPSADAAPVMTAAAGVTAETSVPVPAAGATAAAAQEPVQAAAPPAAPPAVTRTLAHSGRLEYTLYLGADEFGGRPPGARDSSGRRDGLLPVGRAVQEWQVDGDRYVLKMSAEPSGLPALFVHQRYAYESRGTLTPQGLRPQTFAVDRTRRGATEHGDARFDWNAMTVAFGTPAGTAAALPADTQDQVSFIYQLGLTALAPGRLRLPVVTGWKIEEYELEVGDEQTIQTPFGALKAVRVRQLREAGKESIELWLATAYQMLPVRIRYYDRAGKPNGELLVRDLRVQ